MPCWPLPDPVRSQKSSSIGLASTQFRDDWRIPGTALFCNSALHRCLVLKPKKSCFSPPNSTIFDLKALEKLAETRSANRIGA
ncbi:hypothetical protein L596_000916 [Steinernema carpocapsae]|uniref:Uncharacterized protein n=1 Tax=Steinernema carpocapsae TaxID=34508 RepID=A0A4U8UJX3_STECR|nr:hypothetical protein L596_000916 [Steinernema carpocapsae]